jgi:hypothetical protein
MKLPLDLQLLDDASFVVLSDFFCQWRHNPIILEIHLALMAEADVRDGRREPAAITIDLDLEILPVPIVLQAIKAIGAAAVRSTQLVLFRGATFCMEIITRITSEADRLQKPPPGTAIH